MKRKKKNITRTLPIHNYVLEQLEDQLDFGNYVKWEELEYHSDIDREIDGQINPKFMFFMVQFRQSLEQRGLFITERGVPDGFRILQKTEVADHVRSDLKKKTKSIRRKAIGVGQICRNSLTDEESRKLDHEEKRAAWMAEINTQILRKQSLPEPSTVKSIKNLLRNG
jgi:hypothetical protein